MKWWIEIDLEREPSAGGPSLACSAGPVQPVESSVRSLRPLVKAFPGCPRSWNLPSAN